MATISSYDSSSISTLFSSFSNKKTSNVASDLLGISYSDYAIIKNGSYHKLMKAYYSGDEKTESIASSTATAKDTTKTLASVENAAEDVKKKAEDLLSNGSKSVFRKESVKGSDGTTTQEYDKDAIYKAVSNFASSYNDLLDAASKSNTNQILSTTKSLVTYTSQNEKLLGSIGITIGSDNKMSVDETQFKKADMSTVKSIFQTTGAYGYQVSAKASMIQYYAQNEASKSNTYSKNGMYTYNYNSGQIYQSTT